MIIRPIKRNSESKEKFRLNNSFSTHEHWYLCSRENYFMRVKAFLIITGCKIRRIYILFDCVKVLLALVLLALSSLRFLIIFFIYSDMIATHERSEGHHNPECTLNVPKHDTHDATKNLQTC